MKEPNTIQCLIVDDEPPARAVLTRYIEEVPLLNLAGACSNAVEAMSFLQRNRIDLLFLDIRMPQLNGNELLKILKHPPRTILTTAYPEYALEGYDLDVVDYLLKPIQFERFLKAVHKTLQTPQEPEPAKTRHNDTAQQPFVYFRADRKMIKVLLNDILYIESMKDYIKVFTVNGTIITKQSISSVEAMLPQHLFVRTHRSFIVALQHVRSYTSELVGIGKNEIPIGKLFRNTVLKVLG